MLFKPRRNTLYIKADKISQSYSIQNVDPSTLPMEYRFEREYKAYKAGYEPMSFMLCVRTPWSNRVLTVKDKPIVTFSSDTPCIHKGMDLIMYLCSCELLRTYFNYSKEVDNLMLHTEFQYAGFYNPVPGCYNPTIVCTIYIDEAYVEEFNKYLKEHVEWKELSCLDDSSKKAFPKRILETLLKIVDSKPEKGEEDGKSDDNV